MKLKKNNLFFSVIVIMTIIISMFGNLFNVTSVVHAEESPRYKTFKSLDRGNFTYPDKIRSIGYIDKITEKNPKGGLILGTRYKTDENGTIVYCLNWELDSPKSSGNNYVATNEKVTNLEYTAMVYGYGGEKDRTERYKNPINNNNPFNANERYYISQMALYAVTSDKGTKEQLRIKDMIKHTRKEVNEAASEALYKAIVDHTTFIRNNTLPVPKEEKISIDIVNKENTIVDKGDYLQTEKALRVKTDNTKGTLTLDKKGLGNAYFIDLQGKKVTDDYVLKGNEFHIRLDKTAAAETGNISFNVSGKVIYTNLTKFAPVSGQKGVENGELQRITWVSEETTNASNSFKVNYENKPIIGGLEINKTDISDGKPLANAEFQIKNDDGEIVAEVATNEEGKGAFQELPYGKYTYQEVVSPEGYVLDKKEFPFEIKENGEIVKAEMTNKPIEGGFEITKVDVDTEEALAGAEFVIKDESGNEVTKVTTDKNGKATVSGLKYGKYTYQEVEAPEGYLLNNKVVPFEVKEDGKTVAVNETNKVFEGDFELTKTDVTNGKPLPNAKFEVKDSNGKVIAKGTSDKNGKVVFKGLKYGKYTYQEVEAPEGYVLNNKAASFEIKKDGQIIKAEVTNEKDYKVGTTATYEGLKDVANPNMVTIVDVVEYENLYEDKEYTIKGKLMDKETGEPVLIDGKEVTGETTFTPEKTHGTVEVEFIFDKSKLATDTVVVFEDLFEGEKLVAVHHDINDKDQTVEIPSVGTKAAYEGIGNHEEAPHISTIVDIVEYKNLHVGKEYVVSGKLMNKETGKPVLIDGKEVTGETTFTPEKANGTVEVVFTFDKSELETDTVVVFEDLHQGKMLVAVHHDINDKDQTVEIPKVGTTASFAEIDAKNPDISTIVDIVEYKNLHVGKEYVVSGKLMNKETGEPVLIDGKEVTGETTFTPEKTHGTVEVEFIFDKSKLATDTVVVFEDLFEGEKLVAVHHDIEDIGQTVEIPRVGTKASFAERDTEEVNMVTIVDELKYENLVIGKEYVVNGKLMNKETGEPVLIDGEKVTGETIFTPEQANGTVEVSFTFDQSQLETRSVVVFEDVYKDGLLVAVHHDIEDEAQTVSLVDIKVFKTNAETGEALEGVEFTMYDLEGNVLDVQLTGKDGFAYFEIVEGEEVTLVETKALEGYVVDQESYEVTDTEGKEVVELNVLNIPIRGDLEVIKLDKKNKEVLEGAKFEVINSDNEVVEVIVTDEDGVALAKDLAYGKYTLKEVEAPKGYELNDFVYKFEITEHGEVITLEVTNDKIVEIEEPKRDKVTGKPLPSTATDTWNILLIGAALLVVGTGYFIYRKRKKKALTDVNQVDEE